MKNNNINKKKKKSLPCKIGDWQRGKVGDVLLQIKLLRAAL